MFIVRLDNFKQYVDFFVMLCQQKGPGLFSLLPKPKHSVVVKENNPNRPVAKISNRPLIPDSLRRKQAKKPTPQVKKAQAKDDGSDDDSDDDEGGSFFSWNEPKAEDASMSQVTIGTVALEFLLVFVNRPGNRI